MLELKLIKTASVAHRLKAFFVVLSVVFLAVHVPAQTADAGLADREATAELRAASPVFRVEKAAVAGGSEIITIFGRQSLPDALTQGPVTEIPLVSVLRDTLGDEIPENDRLRYVWMHTFTKASLSQKISAFVPFLYTRTTNKASTGTAPPPPVIDVQSPNNAVWNKVLWMLFKRLLLGEFGVGMKASALQYNQNKEDYRRSAIAGTLTVLSMYQEIAGEKILSDSELRDIQARLSLTDKTFGVHMQNEYLDRVYQKELTTRRDFRGHNWELLRQYAESQGLYFEPLEMPDGSARHAIVWTTASDVEANKGKSFERRFLNIRNPWTDAKLANWKGYTQSRWYDADDRIVESTAIGAKARTMIPLAIYGLDHPKIPAILVDFRDNGNAKKREISKRILNDLTGDVLSLTQFSGVPYLIGRFIYDFVTGRRGTDVNQASRLRSYAQLKLLLSLDASLEPDFRNHIAQRVESATLNPLQNDTDVEARLAHSQYANLMAYANRPDGLPKKIVDDRREEMVRLRHGRTERALFGVAHVFSFGLYTHREETTPELVALMDSRRQLDFHERYVREVAVASAKPEIDSDMAALKRSLVFISEKGSPARAKTTRAIAAIFAVTDDEEIRRLCLAGLYRVNNAAAKKELLAIHGNPQIEKRWRTMSAGYLKLAREEGQRISARDADAIAAIAAN